MTPTRKSYRGGIKETLSNLSAVKRDWQDDCVRREKAEFEAEGPELRQGKPIVVPRQPPTHCLCSLTCDVVDADGDDL